MWFFALFDSYFMEVLEKKSLQNVVLYFLWGLTFSLRKFWKQQQSAQYYLQGTHLWQGKIYPYIFFRCLNMIISTVTTDHYKIDNKWLYYSKSL